MERKRECLEEVEDVIQQASRFTYDLLTGDYVGMQTKVMYEIDQAMKYISGKLPKVEKRIIINYAIILGSYTAIQGVDMELMDYIIHRVSNGSQDLLSGDKLHRFAEEFAFGVTENLLQAHHYFLDPTQRFITLWVKGICDNMNKYYNRNGTDNSRLIVQHFSQQSYFVKLGKARFRGAGGMMPSIELDIDAMPELLRNHFESVKK